MGKPPKVEDKNWVAEERYDEATGAGAAVWGDDGDLVALVHGNLAYGIDAIDRARRIAANPDLLAACEALVAEQKYFEEHAQEPGMMPGNQFYSDKFMAVVNMAKAAVAKAKEVKS